MTNIAFISAPMDAVKDINGKQTEEGGSLNMMDHVRVQKHISQMRTKSELAG